MISIRCTQPLLEHLDKSPLDHIDAPTNALGDWYATFLEYGDLELAIFVSERSLLSVATPANANDQLFADFVERAAHLLTMMDLDDDLIEQELQHMQQIQVSDAPSGPVREQLENSREAIVQWLDKHADMEELALDELAMAVNRHRPDVREDWSDPEALSKELLKARWQRGAGLA